MVCHPRARTAAGVTTDGKTLVLFTADQGTGSGGLTVAEVAERLINDHQVAQALNLDGGGSTTLAMADPLTGEARLVNTPSDTPHGRAVGSSLAIFAAPAAGR
ncbi:MAG: phosphodiester glycosidase family protein [Opitutaceae bacterium]|nr:phosphodiester glycosidase family protein [Opitutaceae bacterium]